MPTPSPQQIIAAVQSVARSLGHAPSKTEFLSHSRITVHQFRVHFATWNNAVKAAGFPPNLANVRMTDEQLLTSYGLSVRTLGTPPTYPRYIAQGHHALKTRFGRWSNVPDAFRAFAQDKPEWSDVLPLLPAPRSPAPPVIRPSGDGPLRPPEFAPSQSCGNPLNFRSFRHEPMNEQGVILLFGMVAQDLGFAIESAQSTCPDCHAKRRIAPNHWVPVRIEFEFDSRHFHKHGHHKEDCDMIVCWKHSWQRCPKTIEVLELSSAIKTLPR